MSDRIKSVVSSKWTVAILLGVGTVAAAGGAILAVYAVRKWRSRRRAAVEDEGEGEDEVQEPEPLSRVQETAMIAEDVQLTMSPTFEASSPYYAGEGLSNTVTYDGVYTDAQKSLQPLTDNCSLHSVFLQYTQPPRTVDKLKVLLEFLQQYDGALKNNQPSPDNTSPDINNIVDKFSSDSTKLDEIASLVILSEAFMEFPQHIVKRAVGLPHDKRQTLVDLIRSTPYGVDKHVYMDEGPFNDPDLYPIMTRLGLSIPAHQTKLVYDAPDDKKDDPLAAGLFLLLGTECATESS